MMTPGGFEDPNQMSIHNSESEKASDDGCIVLCYIPPGMSLGNAIAPGVVIQMIGKGRLEAASTFSRSRSMTATNAARPNSATVPAQQPTINGIIQQQQQQPVPPPNNHFVPVHSPPQFQPNGYHAPMTNGHLQFHPCGPPIQVNNSQWQFQPVTLSNGATFTPLNPEARSFYPTYIPNPNFYPCYYPDPAAGDASNCEEGSRAPEF